MNARCRMMCYRATVCFAVLGSCLVTPVAADEFVSNGDFEADLELWVAYPGYVGGEGLNPPEITDWFGTGGHGINPFQPGAGLNPPNVFGWTGGPTANHGINPVNVENDPNPDHQDVPAPFRDNGDNDTTVAFLQVTQFMQQDITGLVPGTNYILTLDYNARTGPDTGPDNPLVSLELNGNVVEDFPDPDDFPDGVVFPAGEGNPWYTSEIPFTATSSDLSLLISTQPEFGGDSTFLMDNVSLVPEGGGDNLVVNGDFETDPELFEVWPGYVGSEAALRPFNDNGNNRSGIAFLQGTAELSQDVEGLTPGEEYILSLDYNARNCCAEEIPIGRLLLDFEDLEDFPDPDEFPDGAVTPTGGENDWYHYETTFVAPDTFMNLAIQTEPFGIGGGDSTFLIDNVSVRSKTAVLPGDYNENGELDTGDLNLQAVAIEGGQNPLEYDLNGDEKVDFADRQVWVNDLKNTWIGDANLDLEFNSSDMVQVFVRGKYELEENATWDEGDWTGDLRFNSGDMVAAFVAGGYERGPKPAVANAVPEPATWVLALLAALALAVRRRQH